MLKVYPQKFLIGQSVSLICLTIGRSIPRFTWYKNGNPLLLDKRMFLNSPYELFIQQALPQDEGDYSCNADYSRTLPNLKRYHARGSATVMFSGRSTGKLVLYSRYLVFIDFI